MKHQSLKILTLLTFLITGSALAQGGAMGGGGSGCPGASYSHLAIRAILDSPDLGNAYPNPGLYLSSFTDSIVRVPGKAGVYEVTTSRIDGSDRVVLEVTVSGAETCYVGKARVTSVVLKSAP